jgi:hypothetical protein
VVLASSSVQDAYLQKIGKELHTPYSMIRLGLSSFDFINARLSDNHKDECKAELNIDHEKITICIGYNAFEAQNHLAVLKQLQSLPQALLQKITVLLPMTYGGSEGYIASVESAASKLGCYYLLFREYMDKPEIARLRLSTDIFINAQDTDGLSGSVLEALYAGAALLNASWLHYREYAEWGISYATFSDYEEIPMMISKILQNPFERKSENRDILRNQMSWRQCHDAWTQLLTQKQINLRKALGDQHRRSV